MMLIPTPSSPQTELLISNPLLFSNSNMPKGGIRYQYGLPEHSKAISSLGAHVFTVSFAELMPADDLQKYLLESYSPSSIAALLDRPSTTFVLALEGEDNDAIVGFVQLATGTSQACIDDIESKIELQRLYVSEKHQGLGIGKGLMARAEAEARKLGIRHIWLASWELNLKAVRIYEKAGFVKAGTKTFMLGGAELKDWVMVKAL